MTDFFLVTLTSTDNGEVRHGRAMRLGSRPLGGGAAREDIWRVQFWRGQTGSFEVRRASNQAQTDRSVLGSFRSQGTRWLVRRDPETITATSNMIANPKYAPYCLRCSGSSRMTRVLPTLATHHCDAQHDLVVTLGWVEHDAGGVVADTPCLPSSRLAKGRELVGVGDLHPRPRGRAGWATCVV